jgi:hypothetical protein
MLSSLSVAAIAQSSDFQPYFSFGTAHGVSFSSINFYPAVAQNELMGYYGGIAASYISEKNFGLQAELNYSQRGWKEEGTGYSQRRLNYIEMPVLTHFYLGGSFRWFLNVGPKIGYFLFEKDKNTMSQPSTEYTLPIANKFDYGICGGSGFELYTKSMSYVLEARYSFSLSDIFPDAKSDAFGSSGNEFISITLGVFIHYRPQLHH